MNLNERAKQRCDRLLDEIAEGRVATTTGESGTRIVDCGVKTAGGLQAGLALAEVCLADLGQVRLVPGRNDVWRGPAVQVETDFPVAACMASQYAGWQIAVDDYFAMGSGPMRAAYGGEALFDDLGYREPSPVAVGVLETAKLPGTAVCEMIAAKCGIAGSELTLLAAPTASVAGSIQIVARSVETCLHKMHELGFDLTLVQSGYGLAPLPPVAGDDLTAIGRTNDAVLYGGEVTLWIKGEDDQIAELGPRIPSSASPDHGRPFLEIFRDYDHDFYKIDPLLFSPAEVTMVNVDTGRCFRFGQIDRNVIAKSFSGGNGDS